MSEERTSVPSNDPWCSQNTPTISQMPPDPWNQTSEQYISSLEKKLNNLQGRREGNVSSKDVVRNFTRVREAHMSYLSQQMEGDGLFVDGEDESIGDESLLNNLQRRIQPEKPLNTEELKLLVENDELCLHTRELMEQQGQSDAHKADVTDHSTNDTDR